MTIQDLFADLMSGKVVRRPGWAPGIFLRWNHLRGWQASVGGKLWTTEIGMLLAPTELLATDWFSLSVEACASYTEGQ